MAEIVYFTPKVDDLEIKTALKISRRIKQANISDPAELSPFENSTLADLGIHLTSTYHADEIRRLTDSDYHGYREE